MNNATNDAVIALAAKMLRAAEASVRDGEARGLSDRSMDKRWKSVFAAKDALAAAQTSPRQVAVSGLPAVMLTMAVNADGREVHVAAEAEKNAVVALESRGMVKVRRTDKTCAGQIEWWYRVA